MFGKISYTWSLMGESWNVLKQDTKLLVLPLLSLIGMLAVTASFALPLIHSGHWEPPAGDATASAQVTYYAVLFLFYFCNYAMVIFFNSAIVACAVGRMHGNEVTVGDGLRMAVERLPQIIGWALLAATVGLILRIIEDRSKKVGQIVAALLGTAWSLATFLVVPVLVVEKKGPIAAVKESTALLKKTWGEQIVGNFSFGMVFFLMMIPAILLGVIGAMSGSAVVAALCIGVAVLCIFVLALVQSALQAIFQAAIYLHARYQETPAGFDVRTLDMAVGRRPK